MAEGGAEGALPLCLPGSGGGTAPGAKRLAGPAPTPPWCGTIRLEEAMPAYLIVNITVHDREGFEEYRRKAPAVIAAHGGRYLVRGGAMEVMEGDPGLNRVVILEFPSMAAARGFCESEDYAPLIALRRAASTAHIALVEGVPA
nr:DUF1330 domain-containing protein [Neoroseomonas eburnea]